MLRYLFLFLFVVFSAIHLKDSWKDDAGKRGDHPKLCVNLRYGVE